MSIKLVLDEFLASQRENHQDSMITFSGRSSSELDFFEGKKALQNVLFIEIFRAYQSFLWVFV